MFMKKGNKAVLTNITTDKLLARLKLKYVRVGYYSNLIECVKPIYKMIFVAAIYKVDIRSKIYCFRFSPYS